MIGGHGALRPCPPYRIPPSSTITTPSHHYARPRASSASTSLPAGTSNHGHADRASASRRLHIDARIAPRRVALPAFASRRALTAARRWRRDSPASRPAPRQWSEVYSSLHSLGGNGRVRRTFLTGRNMDNASLIPPRGLFLRTVTLGWRRNKKTGGNLPWIDAMSCAPLPHCRCCLRRRARLSRKPIPRATSP